ncbi:tyrosine-type recombinase/integrase [Nocardia sp. X0981]
MRPADAARTYSATITVRNTRATYAAALDRLVTDFGTDTDVALLVRYPDRVSGGFTFVWGGKSAKTFNIRLAALASACGYRRAQGWLVGDQSVWLRARPARPDASKASSRDLVGQILGTDARYDGGPYTLHRLRHSLLTHAAEEGASTPVSMKLSGHTSVRSLAEYARVPDEGLRRYRANSDPAVRRLRRQ